MDSRTIVQIWDQRCQRGEKDATIGVNWSAVGPVTPATARKVAAHILQAADTADRRIQNLAEAGYIIINPETIR